MANTVTGLIPTIIAKILRVLREEAAHIRFVGSDYQNEAASKGQTIKLNVPGALTVSDVTPAATPPALGDYALTSVDLTLSKWKETYFHLTDKEGKDVANKADFISTGMMEATRSLLFQINADGFLEYKNVWQNDEGTPGTTPFGSDATAILKAGKVLNDAKAGASERFAVFDTAAWLNAQKLAGFQDVDKAGDGDVKMQGTIRRKFGFDWAFDQQVPTHTKGTGSGYLINNVGGYGLGIKTVTVDTGTGTIVAGDLITFGSDTYEYVVKSTVGSPVTSITFEPGLKTTIADNATVTLTANHVVNLGYKRGAFAFASRITTDAVEAFNGGLTDIASMGDPVTGLALTVERKRGHHANMFFISSLYGWATPRPELALRIFG